MKKFAYISIIYCILLLLFLITAPMGIYGLSLKDFLKIGFIGTLIAFIVTAIYVYKDSKIDDDKDDK